MMFSSDRLAFEIDIYKIEICHQTALMNSGIKYTNEYSSLWYKEGFNKIKN